MDPRFEFLSVVASDRGHGSPNPAWFREPPVPIALINAVWAGSEPQAVLDEVDRAEAQSSVTRNCLARVAGQADRLGRIAAEEIWAALEDAGARERHALCRRYQEEALRAARHARSSRIALELPHRYALALSQGLGQFFAAWGRELVNRLPVPCQLLRAIDARVYPNGSGASEGLVHVFPTSDLRAGRRIHRAGQALGRQKRFWSLVSDVEGTPIALNDLLAVERVLQETGR